MSLPGRPAPRRWRRPALAAAGLALVILGGLWLSGLAGLGMHLWNMRSSAAEWRDKGLWLPDYEVKIEALPIAGITDNLSGLTYNPDTGSLFAVINRPQAVVEITPEGKLLRTIPIDGARDPEGITHVAGDLFVLSDEGEQRLNWIEITPATSRLELAGTPQLTLDYGSYHNMGFEGVTWDDRTKRLFIAQEMWPVRVLVVEGLSQSLNGQGLNIRASEWKPQDRFGHFAADLSSLSVHDGTGNLLLLSHLTSALVEYAPDGRAVSVMPLWRGWNGLKATVPQAEGIATDDRGDIYLVSEPNLLYRFGRTRPATWAAP